MRPRTRRLRRFLIVMVVAGIAGTAVGVIHAAFFATTGNTGSSFDVRLGRADGQRRGRRRAHPVRRQPRRDRHGLHPALVHGLAQLDRPPLRGRHGRAGSLPHLQAHARHRLGAVVPLLRELHAGHLRLLRKGRRRPLRRPALELPDHLCGRHPGLHVHRIVELRDDDHRDDRDRRASGGSTRSSAPTPTRTRPGCCSKTTRASAARPGRRRCSPSSRRSSRTRTAPGRTGPASRSTRRPARP